MWATGSIIMIQGKLKAIYCASCLSSTPLTPWLRWVLPHSMALLNQGQCAYIIVGDQSIVCQTTYT